MFCLYVLFVCFIRIIQVLTLYVINSYLKEGKKLLFSNLKRINMKICKEKIKVIAYNIQIADKELD